ncbi:MAG: porin family protein [Bacteroidales bacterium]|nr:porin family protein [Bacteroidales bacterium]
MKKKIQILVVLLAFPFLLSGQKGYYVNDTLMNYGVKLVDLGAISNARYCRVKTLQGKVMQFSPDEVSEYGFLHGKTFCSKTVCREDSVYRVFMERLVKDSTSLYFYRDRGIRTYYLESDSIWEELKNKDGTQHQSYRLQLNHFTSDCPEVADAVRLAGYRKKPLTELMNRYNQCISKPFPVMKLGIRAGYESCKLRPHGTIPDYLEEMEIDPDGGFIIGISIENPIAVSRFSVVTAIRYSMHQYSSEYYSSNADYYFTAKFSAISLPLTFRYTFPYQPFRPYIDAGILAAYNTGYEQQVYQALHQDGIISIDDIADYSFVDEFQAGLTVGCGLIYDLDYRKAFFLEFNLDELFEFSSLNTFNRSAFSFALGFMF